MSLESKHAEIRDTFAELFLLLCCFSLFSFWETFFFFKDSEWIHFLILNLVFGFSEAQFSLKYIKIINNIIIEF